MNLIDGQAQREGKASHVERRLLLFSVDEAESAEGIPEERLYQGDSEFENRADRYSKLSTKSLIGNRERALDHAISKLKKGDHYILVITGGLWLGQSGYKTKTGITFVHAEGGYATTFVSILF